MEQIPENEPISEVERRSALIGFVVRILYSNNIISPSARDDVATELHIAQEDTTWECGTPITEDERHNVAAMRAMQQVFDSLIKPGASHGAVRIWRELDGEEQLYDYADETFRFVGLDQTGAVDISTVLAANEACSEAQQTTRPTRAMQEVWLQRGKVIEHYDTDVPDALQDTITGDDDELPDSEYDAEIPFYHQYISTQVGAHAFFMALLADMQTLDLKLRF